MDNAWGVSPLTLNLIKRFEGYTPKPKWDYRQHSVGYGTRWEPGTPVGTQQDHEAALAREAGNVNGWLAQNVTVPLDEQKRGALTSFGFNLGVDDLERLKPDINAGNWPTVAKRMLSFNKAGGEVNQGLVNRRRQEAETLLGQSLPQEDPSMLQPRPSQVQALGGTSIGAPTGGPMPAIAPAPDASKSALVKALLQAHMQRAPQSRNWMEAIGNAMPMWAAAYKDSQLSDEKKAHSSSLAKALMGAKEPDALVSTLLGSGDPDLQKSAVQMKVAQMKPKSEIGRFRPTKQGVVDTTTGQIVPGTEAMGAEAAEFGTTPVPYIDKDGNTRYTQMSKAGGRKDIDLPEGARWATGVDKVDVGTGTVLLDKKTGADRGVIQKDIIGKESQEEIGKSQGLARQSIPAAKTMVENAFKTIGELETHPGLETGTGLSNVIDPRSWTPGTPAYDFLAKNKQAMGQSFMAARDSLKGAGQVTDFEGAKGEQAIANLDAAQSQGAYLDALKTLKTMMQASYDDLQKKAGVAPQGQGTTAPDVNSLKQKYGLE